MTLPIEYSSFNVGMTTATVSIASPVRCASVSVDTSGSPLFVTPDLLSVAQFGGVKLPNAPEAT
jgi:hypothetical protein